MKTFWNLSTLQTALLLMLPVVLMLFSCKELPTDPQPTIDIDGWGPVIEWEDGYLFPTDPLIALEDDTNGKRCKLTPEICAQTYGGQPQCWNVEEFGTCPGPDCQCACQLIYPGCL